MSAPGTAVDLITRAEGQADGPFEAGQMIAQQTLIQALRQAGADDAAQIAAGMFSSAMATLQAIWGTEAVRGLFDALASTEDGKASGVH
jgi:hypothetical protein